MIAAPQQSHIPTRGAVHAHAHVRRLDAKYDKALETGLTSWIESTTGDKIGDDFQTGLKNGIILCKCGWKSTRMLILILRRSLMNKLKPGSVKKVNGVGLAFKEVAPAGATHDTSRAGRWRTWARS